MARQLLTAGSSQSVDWLTARTVFGDRVERRHSELDHTISDSVRIATLLGVGCLECLDRRVERPQIVHDAAVRIGLDDYVREIDFIARDLDEYSLHERTNWREGVLAPVAGQILLHFPASKKSLMSLDIGRTPDQGRLSRERSKEC